MQRHDVFKKNFKEFGILMHTKGEGAWVAGSGPVVAGEVLLREGGRKRSEGERRERENEREREHERKRENERKREKERGVSDRRGEE